MRNIIANGIMAFMLCATFCLAEDEVATASADVGLQRIGQLGRPCNPSEPNACPREGTFCRVLAGRCDDEDARGVCTAVPRECSDEVAPVCGCDGRTYPNRCEAARAQVSVERAGACQRECTSTNQVACEEGEYCRFRPGSCREEDATGYCTDRPTECGDQRHPVCGCDGITYPNRCLAAMAGASIAEHRACRQVCDRANPGICGEGSFCHFRPGTCDSADAQGVCEDRPDACPSVYIPVCGCDGMTYGNNCEAAVAGVSIAHLGECPQRCDGIAGLPCDEGEFCRHPAGECDLADGMGICVEIPDQCRPHREPVCGCDGTTYANRCEAIRAGAQIDHPGPCVQVCDGIAGLLCDEGEFCQHRAGQCNVADVSGVCIAVPAECRPIREPVCGCDGTTYANRCEAIRAGAQIDHLGPCVQQCDGIAGLPCNEGEFCQHRAGECNVADAAGVCVAVPAECRPIREPVCGCDGTTYMNRCASQRAGVQVDHPGRCRN